MSKQQSMKALQDELFAEGRATLFASVRTCLC